MRAWCRAHRQHFCTSTLPRVLCQFGPFLEVYFLSRVWHAPRCTGVPAMLRLRKALVVSGVLVACMLSFAATAFAQFETRGSYAVGSPSPRSVAVGDFNRDGNLDIAVGGTSLSVLMGNGDGTFQKPVQYPVGVNPESVATADFNGDGNLDLVAANFDGPSVSILLGNGDGTFQAAQNFGL